MSAVLLQRVLGWSSYQTAWTCLHKIRRAMIQPCRERLAEVVEVYENYMGGDEKGVFGRHIAGKALVILAAEEDGRGIGRIRLRHIPDSSAASLIPFIEESIEPNSTVHTDGWYGYLPLRTAAYQHPISNQKGHLERSSESLPRVHQVFSLLKSWLLGTHQGSVPEEHLQDYLNEITFRFNRRKSRSNGKFSIAWYNPPSQPNP